MNITDTDYIKSLVRPVIVYWSMALLTLSMVFNLEMPDILPWILTAVIVEYFGERAVKRLKEM